ncbi:hypothetical protein HDU67_006121 [Dinochytrium kinnereticum]|nr:hypothetical protein HDU67_006121 [Dinochytrium kinnereticum]
MRLFSATHILAALASTVLSVAAQDCKSTYTDLTGSSAITYRTEPVWINGKRAWCWPFSDRNSATVGNLGRSLSNFKVAVNSVIYVVYPDGTSAGAPIVSALPCDPGYSDARLKLIYQVDYSVKKNTVSYVISKPDTITLEPQFRDFDIISGIAENIFVKNGYHNLPIVPPGSSLEDTSGKTATEYDIQQAWYNGKKVFLFDFGPIKQDSKLSYVAAAGAVEVFGDDAFGIPIKNGFTVLSLPNDGGYTGFFTSSDTTGAPFNYLRYYSNFTGPDYVSDDRGMILNCPVVYEEDFVYKGSPPIPEKPSIESKPSASIPPPPPPIDFTKSGNCFDPYLNGPAGEYLTAEAFIDGKTFGCWNLGLRSALKDNGTQTIVGNALQPVYPTGEKAGLPIFGDLPCQSQYSDAVKVLNAVVPATTPFNFFKDFAGLKTAASSISVSGVFNYPIVEPGSRILVNPADSQPSLASLIIPRLRDGWYQGQPVHFFDFDRVPDLVPNADVIVNGRVTFPFKDNGAGQSILKGEPIFDVVQGDPSYTGFYGVGKVQYDENETYKSSKALEDYTIADMGKVLNCPTAYFLGA